MKCRNCGNTLRRERMIRTPKGNLSCICGVVYAVTEYGIEEINYHVGMVV